jgi:hypothetical protein
LTSSFEVVQRFLQTRVMPVEVSGEKSDPRDIGIYFWRQQALDVLENAVRGASDAGVKAVPILGKPEWLDSGEIRRFQWTGIIAEGKRCHLSKVPCHTDLERQFADFLDRATDVVRYFKNERYGFSITYYENNRPRQYYPDFIIATDNKEPGETYWIAETKGEIRPNTPLKSNAAKLWCEKMSTTLYGAWKYLFVPQRGFEKAAGYTVTLEQLAEQLGSEAVPLAATAAAVAG